MLSFQRKDLTLFLCTQYGVEQLYLKDIDRLTPPKTTDC